MEDISSPFADYSAPASASDQKFCENSGTAAAEEGQSKLLDDTELQDLFCKKTDTAELFQKHVTNWESKDLIGKSFATIDDAELFYIAYSRKLGFGVRRDNKEIDKNEGITTMRRFVCHREGKTNLNKNENPSTKCMARTRCSCKAALVVRYNRESGTYKVSTFNSQHNHTLANEAQSHFFRCNRKITEGQAMEIRKMKDAGIKTCSIMNYMVVAMGGFDKVGFNIKDLYNHINWDHERKFRLNKDAESTISYLTALADIDPGLYVMYALDEKNRLCRLLWADSSSQQDYKLFGDVVVIDSTYRTNRFKLPLVEFVGVNNHKNTVIFACSLIIDETIDAYKWAFSVFMKAMEGKEPVCVLTDGDKAIASALTTEMPRARHRLCSWHLMRNARVVSAATNFLTGLGRVMRRRSSEDDFEREWKSLLEEYGLIGNKWMEELYSRKTKWGEPFFKGVFCAGMTTTQRCESVHSYMSGFVNSDLSLYEFVKQFCRATCRIRQQTLKQDFINSQTNVDMVTHLKALEKSAYDFYSRGVFLEVREEITKESIYTPTGVESVDGFMKVLLVKYGDEAGKKIKACIRHSDQYIVCECGRFESFGWPCRHMFCAMKIANMTSIPNVLLNKRWAKDCSRGDNSFSNKDLSKTNPMDRRFAFLHPKVLQLCTIASTSDELYNLAIDEIDSITTRLYSHAATATKPEVSKDKKRKHLLVNQLNIIRDPCIVKTKGSQSDKKNKGKSRKCRICRQPGHYKPNCPIVNDVSASDKVGETDEEENEEDSENLGHMKEEEEEDDDDDDDLFY